MANSRDKNTDENFFDRIISAIEVEVKEPEKSENPLLNILNPASILLNVFDATRKATAEQLTKALV
ncbi:MAG: hypothetical protein ACE365_03700 [Gammaproteobacteria bacterium]